MSAKIHAGPGIEPATVTCGTCLQDIRFNRPRPVCKGRVRVFPPGAKVLVDGERVAIVQQAFPEGSSSYLFPHYKLNFVSGDKNVAIAMYRVGVTQKEH